MKLIVAIVGPERPNEGLESAFGTEARGRTLTRAWFGRRGACLEAC